MFHSIRIYTIILHSFECIFSNDMVNETENMAHCLYEREKKNIIMIIMVPLTKSTGVVFIMLVLS